MNPQIHADSRIAPPPPPLPSVQPVPARFLELLGEGDFAALAELFTEDVWLRALLVREVHEETTAAGAAEAFRDWVGSPHGARLLEAEHHTVAGRERLRYRFLVRPTWAPDAWHVLEQTGFCRVKDGRISRFDLACTGYFPAGDELLEVVAE
jgi:hypothetical protein